MMTYEEAAAVRTYSDAEIGTLWDAFLSIVPDECNLDTKVQRDLLFALCKTAPYCRETEFPDGTIELVGRFVNDRGNGTPPFRVKGTPVRACEGHAG